MRRISIIGGVIGVFILGILILKFSSGTSSLIWDMSAGGIWLLPLVLASALLDSVHPCSFSILLITIAFLFGLQMTREKILKIGGMYIAGIFASYLLIGLGILKVLHIFNTPHFMGKLGATLLIIFGVINLINRFFPNVPIKLALPSMVKGPMARLMEQTSMIAAFGLGALVGICQFPCMGGPYLMVIGLLRDQVTFTAGFWYLILYNVILIIPLALVLWFSADKAVVDKLQEWKRDNLMRVRLVAGIAMMVLGALILIV
ncbi:MAG: cytochrome c biogenesis protein CcdA [Patescibacteria group bacterium]